MKRVTALFGVLLGVFAIAGCQSTPETSGYRESACQRDLARLMSDQPGYTPPAACDSTFVTHLEATR